MVLLLFGCRLGSVLYDPPADRLLFVPPLCSAPQADIEIMMPFCIRTKACLLCERDFTKPTNKLKTPVRLFVGGNDTHVAKSFTEWNSVSLSAEEGGDFTGELLAGFEHLYVERSDAGAPATPATTTAILLPPPRLLYYSLTTAH